MSFIDLARERRSVRTFEDRPVEQEKIDLILEAGRMMHNATCALLVCYDADESWHGTSFGEPDYDGGEVDAAIVTTSMMMEATDLGVGTLWVRGFNAAKAAEVFELPANIRPVCFLVLGYATEAVLAKPHTPRKELGETVTVL